MVVDPLDATVIAEGVVNQIASIVLIGSAVLGVYVLFRAYRWLRAVMDGG